MGPCVPADCLEGGPPLFNLVTAAQAQNGGNSYTRRGLFGSTGSDGQCSYYMHPNGSSVRPAPADQLGMCFLSLTQSRR